MAIASITPSMPRRRPGAKVTVAVALAPRRGPLALTLRRRLRLTDYMGSTRTSQGSHGADQRCDHRWIVGVDGSECSRHAALWAVAHAADRATELQLASAWSLPVSTAMTPMGAMTTGATFDAIEKSAVAAVDDLAHRLQPLVDVPMTRSVGQGGAASLLLAAAAHADLLVVGSRGRGGFARLVLGSTSTQCATHAITPVAVIPSTAPVTPAATIVVAFDGSPNSIAALAWANAFASAGSTIDCVSVWDTTPIVVGADQFYFPEASDLAEERFAHLVMRTIRPIERTDIEVRRTFASGRPRSVLADVAASADLLVMGARGHGAIGAAVLGSVSTWLLHHVDGAMVVVPHELTDDDALDTDGPPRED